MEDDDWGTTKLPEQPTGSIGDGRPLTLKLAVMFKDLKVLFSPVLIPKHTAVGFCFEGGVTEKIMLVLPQYRRRFSR